MKKLNPEEIQEGKVFHNAEHSVRVLGTETLKFQSPPIQVQAVVFQELGNQAEAKRLPIDYFCARYTRKKK